MNSETQICLAPEKVNLETHSSIISFSLDNNRIKTKQDNGCIKSNGSFCSNKTGVQKCTFDCNAPKL